MKELTNTFGKGNPRFRQYRSYLRDKIVQEAIRMALEPIFEIEFHDSSYGFRPNRSAHHAISQCRQFMQIKFTWVIEGDVKACFDEISHKALLKVVRGKVMDNKISKPHQPLSQSGSEYQWCCSSNCQRCSPRWRYLSASC